MSFARKKMPEQVPIGIVTNSPSLAALHNRLRILNKRSDALFHRAHNNHGTEGYTLEMLDKSDAKLKELTHMIGKVEEKIEALMKEEEMKESEGKWNIFAKGKKDSGAARKEVEVVREKKQRARSARFDEERLLESRGQ